MDQRTARLIDRHVQGLDDPNAPFNHTDPIWQCVECDWRGEDPNTCSSLEVTEAWGEKELTKTTEYFCPKCGADCTEYEPEDPRCDAPEPDDE